MNLSKNHVCEISQSLVSLPRLAWFLRLVSCSGVGSVRCVCVYALVCVRVCECVWWWWWRSWCRDRPRWLRPGWRRTDSRTRSTARDRYTREHVCEDERTPVCVRECLMSACLARVCVCSLLAATAGGALKLQHTHTLSHRLRPQLNNHKTQFTRARIAQRSAADADNNFSAVCSSRNYRNTRNKLLQPVVVMHTFLNLLELTRTDARQTPRVAQTLAQTDGKCALWSLLCTLTLVLSAHTHSCSESTAMIMCSEQF